jgi:hypothetical protein
MIDPPRVVYINYLFQWLIVLPKNFVFFLSCPNHIISGASWVAIRKDAILKKIRFLQKFNLFGAKFDFSSKNSIFHKKFNFSCFLTSLTRAKARKNQTRRLVLLQSLVPLVNFFTNFPQKSS